MSRFAVLTAVGLAMSVPAFSAPASAQVSIGISVQLAPPALPVYAQPPLPGPDYIWVPGYWAWDGDVQDYYWVPGTWALAPRPGLLWTPAWWGWDDGVYVFHSGYWGPEVGFYGGIAYGFGYTGMGYAGGYWQGGHVFYNRTVNNITNVNITNVYNKTVVNNRTTVSYNGGPNGVVARPTPQQIAAMRAPHIAPTANQMAHVTMARQNQQAFAKANNGHPPIAATVRPRQFAAGSTVPARGAPPRGPGNLAGRPHSVPMMPAGRQGAEGGPAGRPAMAPPHVPGAPSPREMRPQPEGNYAAGHRAAGAPPMGRTAAPPPQHAFNRPPPPPMRPHAAAPPRPPRPQPHPQEKRERQDH